MIGDYKIVFFDQYCETCKHEEEPETSDKCAECLDIPARIDSHKPENWEAKD